MDHSRMGSRAKSAGNELGRVASMAEEIEYELANVEDDHVDEGGGGRVVMMYDEDGNATPMQMGQFYYDSVKPEQVAETAETNIPKPLDSYQMVEDAEDEEYEDDDVDEDDPYQNQFMRISIPAQQLKDVSRVKKDLDHDKPQRKASLMAGLQRAVSSVRIGETRMAVRQPSESRASLAQVGRMMSMNREKGEVRGLQRERSVPAPKPTRQSLGAVGRMMSMTKKKPAESLSSTSTERTQSRPAQQPTHAKRAGLAQVGRLMSLNKKKTFATDSGNDTSVSGEVGRESKPSAINNQNVETESIMSERSDDRERSQDRERRDSKMEKSGGGQVRMSLTKMGRLMSLSRKKQPSAQPAQQPPAPSDYQEEGGQGQKLQMSPISTSTVSSKAAESTPGQEGHGGEGDRQRPSTASSSNTRKEATRMSLKAAGRLLSFSRKPAANSNKGRTLLAQDAVQRSESTERNNRAQSMPPKGGREDSAASNKGVSGQKLDGRATNFFYTEVNSQRVRMSGILGSDTHIRIPEIALAEYSGPVSRTKWYIDGFTLPHNAVRRECIDLYEILASMARFRGDGDITRDDINDFEDWWKVATEFITCYFEMERTVLFPWVDSAGTKDWEVQLALKKMRSMKDKLQEHLTRVDNVWNEKLVKDPGEMFGLVYKAVDDFVPRLMNYFADQEVLLPAIVKGYYTLDDRLKLDKDMVNAFMGGALTRKNKEESHHNLILLIRWIGNSRQLRAWVGKNLNSVARGMYGTWYEMYQEQHYRFVRTLKSRSKNVLVETGG